jgi:glyoxylase-like metal-dependent hydrolase (beta-lactamase superfamily II)
MGAIVESQVKTRSSFVCFCKDFLPINDGDEFPVCDGKLCAIHAPGHSDGQCILFWPEKKLLFSADMLLPASFSPIFLRYFGDQNPVRTFLGTLSGFLNRDIDNTTILPGHGWPFNDPVGRAKLEAQYYLEKSEWYYRKCAQGMSTAWEIALELFENSGCKHELRSIFREAMAYMEYLTQNGRVIRETHSGGVRFLT